MNSIKIKCKESFSSFGSFPKDYNPQLTGNIGKTEFENLIDRINNECKSSFNKGILLFLLGPLAGIALVVVGIVKWRKFVDSRVDKYDGGFNGFSSSSSSSSSTSSYTSYTSSYMSSSSGFSSSFPNYLNTNNINAESMEDADMFFSNKHSYELDKPLFYFVIGIGLFIIGACAFGIAYYSFKRKVLGKIEDTLVPINSQYSHKQINFSLEDVMELEPVPDWEYNNNKNNQAYMNSITFDSNGRPFKKVEVHYLVIRFPLSPVQHTTAMFYDQQSQQQPQQPQQPQPYDGSIEMQPTY